MLLSTACRLLFAAPSQDLLQLGESIHQLCACLLLVRLHAFAVRCSFACGCVFRVAFCAVVFCLHFALHMRPALRFCFLCVLQFARFASVCAARVLRILFAFVLLRFG